MGSEKKEKTAQQDEQAAKLAQANAADREAYHYWGYLFKTDKCGTPMLDRLLKGIAKVISKRFEPSDSPDLTPSQIAAWYRDVGGDYDVLFTDTPASSIAFIYKSLGAFHSLQPAPNDDGYSSPTVPALKFQGFVTWQTIQLLLGPEDHVPFLQKAVDKYDVVDPDTGDVFPKTLPSICFPDRPDDAMEKWYQGVAERLKREAEEEANGGGISDEPRPRLSTDMSGDASSADDKSGAYKYFEDPMYRNVRARPTIMRHVSKQATRPSDEQAQTVASRVRHMFPWGSRRKQMPGRYESDSYSDEDATPVAGNPPPAARYINHKRPHPPRREDPLSTTDSDSDPERPPSHRRGPVLRTRRSHEPTATQAGYFPAYQEVRRYSHHYDPHGRVSSATSPQPAYRPTHSPLFATQVAQMERQYYDRRPVMPPRTSYKPVQHGVRWGSPTSLPVSPPRDDAPYVRERERERDHHRDHEHDRHADSYESNSGRSRRRRSTEDATYPRERDRDGARTRSHDRISDEWDDRQASRDGAKRAGWEARDDRSRERSRDDSTSRDRKTHRYVSGVQDGVSGRRYPVVGGPC